MVPAQEPRHATSTTRPKRRPGSTRSSCGRRPCARRSTPSRASTTTTSSRRRTRARGAARFCRVFAPRRGCSSGARTPSRGPGPSTTRSIDAEARSHARVSAARRETAARLRRAATATPSPAAPEPYGSARPRSHDPPSAISQSPACGRCMSHRERGQDAADGCPKVLERVQSCLQRALPASSGAGAPAQAPRRLASWGRAAPPRGPRPRRPWCARSFVGAAQTNGDRATRPPARIHKQHPRCRLPEINGDRREDPRSNGAARRYYNRRPPLLL